MDKKPAKKVAPVSAVKAQSSFVKAQSSQAGPKVKTARYQRMMDIVGRSFNKKLAERAVKGKADEVGVKKLGKPVQKASKKPIKKGSTRKKNVQGSDEQESSVSDASVEFRAFDKMTDDALTPDESMESEDAQNLEVLQQVLNDQVSDVAQYGFSEDEVDDIVSLARSEAGCGRSSYQSGSLSEESESSQILCRNLRGDVEKVIADVSQNGLSEDEGDDIVSQAADELSSESEKGSRSGAKSSSQSGSSSKSSPRLSQVSQSGSETGSYESESASQLGSVSQSSPRLSQVSQLGSESGSSYESDDESSSVSLPGGFVRRVI
jgi:hypothetical protein